MTLKQLLEAWELHPDYLTKRFQIPTNIITGWLENECPKYIITLINSALLCDYVVAGMELSKDISDDI